MEQEKDPAMSSPPVTQKWIENVVGRDWEIFWKQNSSVPTNSSEGENSTATNSVDNVEPSVTAASTQENDESTPKKDTSVQNAQQDVVMSEAEPKEEQQEDVNSFQQQQDEDDEEEEEEEQHEDDWYAGQILSLYRQERDKHIFRLRFVGDDTVYEMALNPDWVRPCARAWTRRTRTLLGAVGDCNEFESLCKSLPQDTHMLQDVEKLRSIEQSVHQEFPAIPAFPNDPSLQSAAPTREELEHMREFIKMLRQQTYLRTRLAPIVDHGDSLEDEDEPTEAYVNHLVKCMEELEVSCRWYYRCWQLHSRVFQPNDPPTDITPITREYLLKDCLDSGRQTAASLVSMDPSIAGCKRKRKAPPSSASGSRRTKRKRKSKGFSDFWTEGESGERHFNEELDEEDFLSTDIVRRLVERMAATDTKWFSLYFGKMLRSLSSNIVAPFIRWERRSQFYLGERDTLNVESSDGETSEEESDDDEESGSGEGERTPKEKSKSQFVTYEDVEAVVEAARHDRVLRHFALSELVVRLEQKLAGIHSFNIKAWQCIDAVLDDSVSTLPSKEKDEILKVLLSCRSLAQSKDSTVWNVNPIGRTSSSLNRKVIENAVTYREWFLDLMRAESVRERVAFVDSVVSRMTKLPYLSSSAGSSHEGKSITAKLKNIAPRVQALSVKFIDHIGLFQQYKSMLSDRNVSNDGRKGLLTIDGARSSLAELQRVPVLSTAEEMVAVRLDVLSWESAASELFKRGKPTFDQLSDARISLDSILQGHSITRHSLAQHLEANPDVDAEIREFGKADIEGLCDDFYKQIVTLHCAAAGWKERADAILTTLRTFGNEEAGGQLSIPKSPAMVDFKRIEDSISDYERLGVDLQGVACRLVNVHKATTSWSLSVSEQLLDETTTFESCLSAVEDLGKQRPRGVIVNPTRQVMDILGDLLRWHASTRKCVDERTVSRDQVLDLLLEGLEVVELFSKERQAGSELVVNQGQAVHLLSAKQDSRRSRVLSLEKLRSNPMTNAILSRMVNESRDRKEGYPILYLLHSLWQFMVEDFTERSTTLSLQDDCLTLKGAKTLIMSRPQLSGSVSVGSPAFFRDVSPGVATFVELIEEGDRVESVARETLLASKELLRECLHRAETVREHLRKLKELSSDFKGHGIGGAGLRLDDSIEQQLDKDIKVFSWLARTLQYPVLGSDEDAYDSLADTKGAYDRRVPWDVLVRLYESIPSIEDGFGDFANVVLRVRELYQMSSGWNQEVSNLTMISLRGGKRRSTPLKGTTDDSEAEEPTRIDVNQVAELSEDPILSKVSMPRENAIRSMLDNTKNFEIQLHAFLGRDYEGESPDRALIPAVGSLVDEDGKFLLYRLTCSPLFEVLKSSVAGIAEIADNVFADTPGKATFDWIRKAVAWIDSLNDSVTRDGSPFGEISGSRLVIPNVEAKRLLEEGEAILLDVPDDLRRTLSQHRIFVSTNKDGKLTVKSKKGGAHHAVGTVAIRWCPFLFDSLKADLLRVEEWEQKVGHLSTEFLAFCNEAKIKPCTDDSDLFRYHGFTEEVSDLLDDGAELVVAPTTAVVDSSRRLLQSLDSCLKTYSNSDISKRFNDMLYKNGPEVVRDRFRLLDALVNRKLLARDGGSVREDAVNKDGPFRSAGRFLIEKALRKGVGIMNIDSDARETEAFCAVRAWEIEGALFDLTQAVLGESQISPEYRDKARCLKRSLEDLDNIALCVRVLAGEINAAKLVTMSAEQLANPHTRQERAKAEAVAKQSTVLTPGAPLDSTTKDTKSIGKMRAAGDQQRETEDLSEKAKNGQLGKGASPDSQSTGSRSRTATKFGDLVKVAEKSSRPVAPPSLVASLRSSSQLQQLESSGLLSSSSGSDRFILTVGDSLRRKFSAGFHIEDDPESAVDHLLPEVLKEKGRLQIAEYTKFLASKLEGGRWISSTLRLVTFSDRDASEYKKFYKEYEAKKRIAMFSLDDGAKLFLVTPKFHKAAKSLTFRSPTSTYAVVLTRSKRAQYY